MNCVIHKKDMIKYELDKGKYFYYCRECSKIYIPKTLLTVFGLELNFVRKIKV